MSFHKLIVSNEENATQTGAQLAQVAGDPQGSLLRLINYLEKVVAGVRHAYIKTQVGAVQAAATLTLTGLPVADETFVLNGVTFTAKASGATGNEFNIGANATLTAAAIAAAINASVTAKVASYVVASSLAGVVTVTAVSPGLSANLFTLAETLTNATRVDFAGGTNGTEVVLQLGKSS